MDIAATLRDQYLGKRAYEIAMQRSAQAVRREIERMEKAAGMLKTIEGRIQGEFRGASGAAEALRSVAKSVEIDLSDEALGDALIRMADKATQEALRAFGFKVADATPGSLPVHGTVSERPRILPPAQNPPGAHREAQEAVESTEEPPKAVSPPQAPQKRLVPAPPPVAGGTINTVTPRAREALKRAQKGVKNEQGVPIRSEALVDPATGERIPVSEQIVVDNDAPMPGGGESEDKGGVRTHPEQGDEE